MTQEFSKRPSGGGICRNCGHDLEVRGTGMVHCTNRRCPHHNYAYSMGKYANTGIKDRES